MNCEAVLLHYPINVLINGQKKNKKTFSFSTSLIRVILCTCNDPREIYIEALQRPSTLTECVSPTLIDPGFGRLVRGCCRVEGMTATISPLFIT